jgi:hypothetical protein
VVRCSRLHVDVHAGFDVGVRFRLDFDFDFDSIHTDE